MFHVDMLGYLAGTCLLLMAAMKRQIYMRMFNVAGNLFFIAYGFLADIMPVLILNSIIMLIHLYRLLKSSMVNREAEHGTA